MTEDGSESQNHVDQKQENNPEVKPKKSRRSFTANYKLKILGELDRCLKAGETGSLLRREGIYSSQISEWRAQRREGLLSAFSKTRGRKKGATLESAKISDLEKQINALKNKLAQAEAIIDVQKKVSELFGIKNQDEEKKEKNS